MSDLARGSIRFSIDSNYHDLYKELSEGSDPEKAPFRTMKDLFMLAVCLGYSKSSRKPIIGYKRQIFHWTQLSDQVDIPILKAIAIASTGDIQILNAPEKITQIAEEYANSGIYHINVNNSGYKSQSLWNIVNLFR